MAIPLVMADLSTTAASNSPAGTEAPSNADDFLRAIQSIVRTTNAKGADIASAATTDIGAATGEFVDVTGTTTITALGTIAAGIVRTVRFTGALILTHNATSLILPRAANITTTAGDVAQFRSLGSGNWLCVGYSGTNVAAFIDSTPIVKGSADATKLLAFEVDTNQTTGVTRTITTQNVSGTLSLVQDEIRPIDATVAASAMTLTLNPCAIAFRSSTLGSGTINVRAVNTAITTVISSGSTGGTVNAIQSRIMVLAIDNAGTVELAWVNAAGSVNLDESALISTTAEGGAGAADSASVVYSTTARASVPFRIVGFVESTQATAGTWATAPSTIQGAGGKSSIDKATQIISGAVVASTSGTAIDFTGIPAWVKRITIMFDGVSASGTSSVTIQIGDSGGIETSGYSGTSSVVSTTTVSSINISGGFGLNEANAAAARHGQLILSLLNPATNSWVASGAFGRSDSVNLALISGAKSLSATLDRVRITMVNGTDTFDAGSINILYE